MMKNNILVGSALLLSLATVGLTPVMAETDNPGYLGSLIAQSSQTMTGKEIAGQVVSIDMDVVKLKTQGGQDVKLKIPRSLQEQLSLKVGSRIVATLTGAQEGDLWLVSDLNYETGNTMAVKKVTGQVTGISGEVVTVKLDSGEVVKLKVPSSVQTQLALKTGSQIVANLTGTKDGDLWLISDVAYQTGATNNIATDTNTSETTVTTTTTRSVTETVDTTPTTTTTTNVTPTRNTTTTTNVTPTRTTTTTTAPVNKKPVRALW